MKLINYIKAWFVTDVETLLAGFQNLTTRLEKVADRDSRLAATYLAAHLNASQTASKALSVATKIKELIK